ncbi:MAG: AsmA family protein, partial [Rhodospirillaceae bacterium]|nr:AsmA family protein [Rhodospirillaceae bacterium]
MGKKIVIGVFGLVVIILSAVLVVPHFINWNEYKSEIASQLKSATGRDISIAGEISMRIIPTPALTVGGITIANIAGAAHPEMVNLNTLQVRVALLPLLGGEVQIERVLLKNPTIHLEKLSNGQANWNFDPASSEKPQSPGTDTATTDAGTGGTNIKLDSFEISNATIVYIDSSAPRDKGEKAKEQRVEGLDLSLRADSLSGPFEGKGRAQVLGTQVSFDFFSGSIIKGRTIPVNLSLFMVGETRINASGAITGLGSDPHYKGKVEINTSNLAEFIDAVAGNASAPAQLGQPFSLGAMIDASADITKLDEMEITIGDDSSNRIAGSLSVGLKDGIQFALDLKAGKINLDQILSKINGSKFSKEPSIASSAPSVGAVSGPSDKKQETKIPTNISGKVTLNISQVTLKNKNISEVELKSNIANGVIGVERISAQLPGISTFKLDGSARAGDGGLVFNGKTSVVSSKPIELASWLGVSLNDDIAQRVRQISYQSNVALNSQSLTLSGINIALDRSRISGGITLALRDRLSFGASLEIDSLNLDSYFPQTPAAKPANDNKSANDAQSGTNDTIANVASVWSALRALNDFDANTKLKAGEITQGGNTYKNISFDGTLYAGQLEIRDARVGSFAGSATSLKGKFNGFGGIPEMSGVKVSLATNDVATLARQYGVASVPTKIGAAKINLGADGSLLKPKINLTAKAMDGEYGLAGTISLLPLSFGLDGHATLKHAKPAQVFSNLGLAYRPKGPLAGMDLGFDIKTDGKEHQISNISGTLDGTPMAGGVNVSTAGTKTAISAALQTGAIYIEHFMPAEGAAKTASISRDIYQPKRKLMPGVILASMNSPEKPVETAQASTSRANKRWSRENIDLSVLDTINADVTLVSSAVYYGKHKLDNADIHATVADGVLLVDRIKATAYGGPVSGSATVRARGLPTMEAKLNISALDVGGALMAASQQSGVKGLLDFNLGFNANGKSAAELVSSLNGAGGLDISSLAVKQSGGGNALSGVIGLVGAMNQLSIPQAGGKDALAAVNVGFDIKDGIASLGNASIASAMGQGNAKGSVDIAAWAMDISGMMTVEPHLVT